MVVCESVPDEGIGISARRTVGRLGGEDHAGQVFEVHLVDDAGVRRNHREVAEGRLAPAQEGVALFVPRELNLGVQRQRLGLAVLVDLHRVVDDQLGGEQGVDALGIAAQGLHGRPHGRQIDHRGHAREVLEQDARRHEGDLLARLGLGVPPGQSADVRLLHRPTVFVTQQVLEENPHGERQPLRRQPRLLERRQAVDLELSFADFQDRPTAEAVRHGRHS